MTPTRSSLLGFALPLVLALGACKLQLHGNLLGSHATSRSPAAAQEHAQFEPQGQTTASPARDPRPAARAPTRRLPAFDERKYQACVAAFDANYAAWLPIDREAKAAIARVAGKSPYVAVNALLAAYAQVDRKAVVRQTGTFPAGAIYAPATRLELATALVALAARTHAGSCVNNQFRIEVDDEYLPPLVGDRERDKVILCGGPSEGARATWLDARQAAAEAFNTPNIAIHDDHTRAGAWSKVAAFTSNAKAVTLSLQTMSGNRRCVRNGRYGRLGDGSWGPLCDYEELPAYAVGHAKAYHFAPQALPFPLRRGDQITLAYELDPEAPAGSEQVARRGGWWWLTSVSHGKQTVYEQCATKTAHQAEVRTTLAPLMIMSRR